MVSETGEGRERYELPVPKPARWPQLTCTVHLRAAERIAKAHCKKKILQLRMGMDGN